MIFFVRKIVVIHIIHSFHTPGVNSWGRGAACFQIMGRMLY